MLITEWRELDKDIAGIYRIGLRAKNQCYIGSSINIRSRIKGHLKSLKKGIHKSGRMQDAFNTGSQLRIFVLEEVFVENRCNLIRREQRFFDEIQPLWNNTLYAWAPMQDPKVAKRQSSNMKITASDPVYKKQHSLRIKKAMNNPETKRQLSQSQLFRYKDEDERLRTSKVTKDAMQQPDVRRRFKAGLKRRSENPEHGAAISRKAKERMQDPAERAKISEGVKRAYKDNPELADNISRKAKERMQDPKVRKHASLKQKEVWENFNDIERREYRKKLSLSHGGDGKILTPKQEAYILNHIQDKSLPLKELARKLKVPYSLVTRFVKQNTEQPRSQKETWSNSKLRERQAKTQKAIWKDPELKARHSQALKDAWKRRKATKTKDSP